MIPKSTQVLSFPLYLYIKKESLTKIIENNSDDYFSKIKLTQKYTYDIFIELNLRGNILHERFVCSLIIFI
jgi:hypothetical protein